MNFNYVMAAHGVGGKGGGGSMIHESVTNLLAVSKDTGTEINVTWTNPAVAEFVKVELFTSTSDLSMLDYEQTVANSTKVVDGVAQSYKKSVSVNTTHFFKAYVTYRTFNVNVVSKGATVSATATNTRPPYIIYGVKIDTTNSNPETALTYTDDAINFTPARGNNGNFIYGSWLDKFPFNQIKPCLLKNGAVNYYLNPNDYTKKLDGTVADIATGNDGDVEVEFPQIYWKFEIIGTDLYIRISDAQVDASYKSLGHTKGVVEKDKVYIGAYIGHDLNGKLRSLSGKLPTVGKTLGQFRTIAKSNGLGYEQTAYYQQLMLQVLFIVMFKNRNSQIALGRGYVDGNSSSIATGGTDKKGMFFGENTGKYQIKFCGIEDFWGNVFCWIDGLYVDVSRNILIGTQTFNDDGSGYVNLGQGNAEDTTGYISEIQGGTETGFIVKDTEGSATTHYADTGALIASKLPVSGGYYNSVNNTGAFLINVFYSATFSGGTISSRLMYL